MQLTRRNASLALVATSLSSAVRGQAPGKPADIPIDVFFEPARLTQAVLNPSGTHVAIGLSGGASNEPRLGVVDLADFKAKGVAAFDDADSVEVHWVNDKRLIFRARAVGSPGARLPTAVDIDGENRRHLRAWGGILPTVAQDDDRVVLYGAVDDSEGPGHLTAALLDTRTSRTEELELPPWSERILLDPLGAPLAAKASRGATAKFYWRDKDGWRVVRELDRYFDDSFSFIGWSPQGEVYVAARGGRDHTALYTFSPGTGQLSAQPMLAVADFDLVPRLIVDSRKLLGLRLLVDAETTVWLDDEVKALQARIDAKLTNTTNLLSLPRRGRSPWVLVWAYSDRQPGLSLAYHRETDKLTVLGHARPRVDPGLMSGMSFVRYAARDGRRIPAYVTVPRSAGTKRPLPMVVLVHDGPFTRGGSWRWQAEVQFLASRGYVVLQPEYRGSTGFGDSHFKAGWRQWGQAMQDDLADGARWAVSEGLADPRRIAIAGGGYGGYAALMGLARQSDVFACAINWAGITDLDLLYSTVWSDLPGAYKDHGLSKVLGDRKADADMLKAHSPLHLAGQIRKPVLMAYAQRSKEVPIVHGERMRDALQPHNAQVEWVAYDDEGPGLSLPASRLDFWARAERFLARHLSG